MILLLVLRLNVASFINKLCFGNFITDANCTSALSVFDYGQNNSENEFKTYANQKTVISKNTQPQIDISYANQKTVISKNERPQNHMSYVNLQFKT